MFPFFVKSTHFSKDSIDISWRFSMDKSLGLLLQGRVQSPGGALRCNGLGAQISEGWQRKEHLNRKPKNFPWFLWDFPVFVPLNQSIENCHQSFSSFRQCLMPALPAPLPLCVAPVCRRVWWRTSMGAPGQVGAYGVPRGVPLKATLKKKKKHKRS